MNLESKPKNWCEVKLGKVAKQVTKGTTPTTAGYQYLNVGIPFVKIENINEYGVNLDSITQFISEEANQALLRSQLEDGDILFSIAGTIGKTALVTQECLPANTNQAVAIIRGTSSVFEAKFLRQQLRSFSDVIAKNKARGGAMNNISLADLKEITLSIPPLAEQHQIAAKLDELLAQVDSIKIRLDTIPKILKRFRQSVLSAAVSGKLTEDFRGNNQLHKEKIENISVLVTKGASPKWQGINYIDDPNQTLFVTSENVGGMKILLDNPKYVEDEFNEKQQRSLLMKGDVLTNIVGASIGRAVVWDKNVKANINQAVCIIRLDKNKCIPDYLCYFLNSPIGIDALIDNKVDVARANVSLGSVKSLELFLPDLSEQTEIVRRVEQLFTYADQIEQRVKDAQARVNHLTQSILAKAFRGELTADWRAQNPDLISGENSAEALLAKIKAQRLKEKPKTGRKARA
jgi:type I restriction enzyme S subunit